MRIGPYLLAATIGTLASAAIPDSASALVSGRAASNVTSPTIGQRFVQKVHGRHCKRAWSEHLGWHRHKQHTCYADDERGFIPGHVLTPYGYHDCIGWWERHPDGRMQCHGQLSKGK